MGVKGLWELLAPVGRRVSVETLAGKKLAIDASIWMVQFMKAMRDEKGEMVRNAHLLGFFRRICKLLFLRTKPVFVFDGGTPALKRRTVIARRRQRENAQAKVRKTAEKLLLNHLKALKLKELANDIKNQRLKQNSDAKGQKKSDPMDSVGCDLGRNNVKELDKVSGSKFAAELDKNLSQTMASTGRNQEELDAMLAASIVAEEDGLLASKGASAADNLSEEEGDTDVEMVLPALDAEVDPSVLAALPQSMQQDILSQLKGKKPEGLLRDSDIQKQYEVNDKGKGKGILLHKIDSIGCSSRSNDVISSKHDQEKVDEMLAASIMAEQNEKLVNNASTSVGAFNSEAEDDIYEEEEEEEEEEMILPAMHGKVDPAVLASLPPSMQLNLLVQMRERLIAENRQKYQKVKKDPAKFSELQIQAYLKTVAFRREIDGVQKAAAGGGVGGVQTSRIASEADREYIFSTSFTGDKQELASTRLEKNKDTQQKTLGNHPSQTFVNSTGPANDSSTSTGLVCNETGGTSDESIQTYLDERGHFRVSRLRALGMRMTRDIQRNLDLMREIEQERTNANKAANDNTVLNGEKNFTSKSCSNPPVGISDKTNADLVGENMRTEHSELAGDTSIEISFMDDGENKFLDGDDDLFANLVAGNSAPISCADNTSSKEQVSDSDSDCDWEEDIIEGKSNVFSGDVEVDTKPSVAKDNHSDESDVEWEDGVCGGANSTLLSAAEPGKIASRGRLEEEADLQEAIRRSLEIIGDQKLNCLYEHSDSGVVKSNYALNQDDNLVGSGVKDNYDNIGVLNGENSMGGSTLQRKDGTEQSESDYNITDDKLDNTERNDLQTSQSPWGQSESSVAFDSEKMAPCTMDMGSHSKDFLSNGNERMKNDVHMVAEQFLGTFNEDSKGSTNCKKSIQVDSLGASEEEKKNQSNEAGPFLNSSQISKPVAPFVELSLAGLTEDSNTQPVLPREDNHGSFKERKSNLGKNAMKAPDHLSAEDLNPQPESPREGNGENFEERKSNLCKDAMKDPGHLSADAVEVNVEEEIQILGQEYINLENEQRKLERNAESVNSELFTECQELLQMFGLPYIIAPMEAEAQCAYLELAKLVDGVVTDDSDVLLFGARSVYKNIFDDRKYVETYFMEDIEKELGLTREKLIRMALLLGSDYTEGVSGIGIVNAIEVVNAFPEEDGLLKFRQWVESPDPSIFGMFDAKSGSSARKRGLEVEENVTCTNRNTEETIVDQNILHTHEQKGSSDYIEEIKEIFMNKHRNVSKNWHIPSSFPSETVISAYSCPQVDKSTDPFTWGKPDHLFLRKLCWEKFGWTSQKADELLLPVLKEYNKNETQLRLEAFYTFNERFAKIRSRRIKKAVKGIIGNQPSELTDGSAEDLSQGRKNETGSPVELGVNRSETLKGTGGSPADMKGVNLKQSRKRKKSGDTVAKTQSRKERNLSNPAPAPGLSEADVQTGKEPSDSWNKSGRGRGRGSGVGVRRGRGKESLDFDSYQVRSSDSDSDEHERKAHDKKSKGPQEVRRSKRTRKTVNYAMGDIEIEDTDGSFDQNKKTDLDVEPIDERSSHMRGACVDDVTDFSRDKESMVNLSPKMDSSRIESGGGFCADEGETSHPGACNYDSSVDADYFKVGGGFCVDDDDERASDHNEIHDDMTAKVDDFADLIHLSGFVAEADCDKISIDQLSSGIELQDRGAAHKIELDRDHVNSRSNYDRSQFDTEIWIPENVPGDTENSMAAFSAMPSLRKKKRKS